MKSYQLEHPDVLPEPLADVFGVEVQLRRGEAEPVTIFLTRDQPASTVQVSFSLATSSPAARSNRSSPGADATWRARERASGRSGRRSSAANCSSRRRGCDVPALHLPDRIVAHGVVATVDPADKARRGTTCPPVPRRSTTRRDTRWHRSSTPVTSGSSSCRASSTLRPPSSKRCAASSPSRMHRIARGCARRSRR